LYYSLQDELVEQNSQGSFVPKGRDDILTMTIRIEEHPGRVCTTGFGVGVRQNFELVSRPSFSINVSQLMMEYVFFLNHDNPHVGHTFNATNPFLYNTQSLGHVCIFLVLHTHRTQYLLHLIVTTR